MLALNLDSLRKNKLGKAFQATVTRYKSIINCERYNIQKIKLVEQS
jgi:hypothetical protein